MSSRIVQLAKIISDNAGAVDDHLQQNGHPEPSFDVGAPTKLATTGEAETSRLNAIAAAEELRDLLTGPAGLLRFDWSENMSLRLISKLNLAQLVPLDGETPFSTIAEKAGLPEHDIARIFRHAMIRQIFREPRKGYVAHTALSQLLAEDEKQQDIASTISNVLWPSALHAADAVAKWPRSEDPSQTGLAYAFGVEKPMWEILGKNPEIAKRFGSFIGAAVVAPELVDEVEWKGKIVDVGGSHGDVMIDILRRIPNQDQTVIVQDLPDTAKTGEGRMPKDLEDRLSFQAHDFFTPQPVSADIYFLRWIFHNWGPQNSVRILKNLVPALKPGAKIIINDYLLPEPNTLPLHLEKEIRRVDLTMLHLLNAMERDADGWQKLFREADERFKVLKISPTKSEPIMAIIEVEWRP